MCMDVITGTILQSAQPVSFMSCSRQGGGKTNNLQRHVLLLLLLFLLSYGPREGAMRSNAGSRQGEINPSRQESVCLWRSLSAYI